MVMGRRRRRRRKGTNPSVDKIRKYFCEFCMESQQAEGIR
jgi:transcription elongation factor Elf1